jgi:hypothetical protein
LKKGDRDEWDITERVTSRDAMAIHGCAGPVETSVPATDCEMDLHRCCVIGMEDGRAHMSCCDVTLTTGEGRTEYAIHDATCRASAEDRCQLYLLSFLLTADHAKAEQCFVTGLDLAADDNTVFREWADSWARQIVIGNALRLIAPHRGMGNQGAKSRRAA